MTEPQTHLLNDAARWPELSADERAALVARQERMTILSVEEFASWIDVLATVCERLSPQIPPEESLLSVVPGKLARFVLESKPRGTLPAATRDRVAVIYRALAASHPGRQHLLRILSLEASRDSLATFVELVADDPPQSAQDVALAFVPLFQQAADYAPQPLFPRLFDALAHPQVAPLVLDLANFLTRSGRVSRHPAADRSGQLAMLLGALVMRLEQIEERPQDFAATPAALTRLVGEAVDLVVGLCDALAQIGDPEVIGKLHQATELHHRRVRTEAAAALARLGDEAGVKMLAELVAEPLVRERALAYLEELNSLDKADEQYRTPVARAEGTLAAWLAELVHFGIPPTSLELVDTRRLYWPGHTKPIDCYLLRYEYRVGEKSLSGIGIVGPVTFAMSADLQDLPPLDIYATYAGWSAEHEEIREQPVEELPPQVQAEWEPVKERLLREGYTDPALVKVGRFFGQLHWVAAARRQEHPGVAVVGEDHIHWYPANSTRRPLGPTEVYYLHKGREILATFNSDAGLAGQ